jgi:hypothetical protein
MALDKDNAAERIPKFARPPRFTKPFALLLISNFGGYVTGFICSYLLLSGAWKTMTIFDGWLILSVLAVFLGVANQLRADLEDRI